MKKWFCLYLVFFCGLAYSAEPVNKSFFGGVAIGGYDAVAYHDEDNSERHQAVKGNSSYQFDWKGATWHFSSEQNRDKFIASPSQYAPVYNGYCANALSLGEGLVKTDGTHWQIFENKLYLFYSAGGRERWATGDHIQYKEVADQAWQQIVSDD